MSDTIRKLEITDDIIDTENEVIFGVLNGAQNITSQRFKSISATPTAMVFNIVVPSLETILDRHFGCQLHRQRRGDDKTCGYTTSLVWYNRRSSKLPS